MNGCVRFRENLALQAAGALPEEAVAPLQAHLRDCPDCARKNREFRLLGRELHGAAARLPERSLSEEFHHRLARRVANGRSRRESRENPSVGAWLALKGWSRGSLAVAVAVVVGVNSVIGFVAHRLASERSPSPTVAAKPSENSPGMAGPAPSVVTWRLARHLVEESPDALDALLASGAEKTMAQSPRFTASTREMTFLLE